MTHQSPLERAKAKHRALVSVDKLVSITERVLVERLSVHQFPCGHERTNENTKLVRNRTGTACRTCFRALDKAYRARKRAAEAETPQEAISALIIRARGLAA